MCDALIMVKDLWQAFDDGATLGQDGSERGVLVRDEEHPLGARISLERGAASAPFAITCGIYGCMMHTRFFSQESEACEQYDAMKTSLSALLEGEDEGEDEARAAFLEGVAAFVDAFP